MNKLMGTGDASVRESSRDAKDIGRIGVWIGGQGNSDLANRTLTEMNKRGMYSRDAYMRDLLANNAMFGGFGQLGSATWRPGEKQILGGFYTQLSWMGGEMGKRDAANSQGRYTPGPAAAMLNQFNVGLMAANSYKNVEMAAATSGTSRGYMWEAQGLAMVRQPLIAVGNGLAVAATLSGGAAWMAPVGLAIKALGESIKVDAQTGKRSFKLTDKQKVNLAVDSAMSALTMGANSYFTTAKMGYNQAKFLKESLGYVKMATNLAMAGVLEDEHGKIDGWKADENFALSATGILVGKLYGNYTGAKHSLATGITNKFIGIGNEYYKFKNNRANQYAQLANPGPEGIGGLFGMGIDAYVARYQEARKLEEKIKEIHGEDIYDALVEKGRVPNPWDPVREKHAMDLLAGAASIANENRRKALIAKVFGIDASIKAIKTGDAGTWVHAALEAEFGGSASFDEVYYEAEKRLLKRAQDGKNSPDDIQHVIAELGGNPNALFAEETTTRYNQRAKSFDRAWAYKQNENERREAVSKITKQFMPQNVHDNGNGTFSYEDPVEQKSVIVSKDEYYKTVEERRTLVDKTPGVDKSAGYNFSHVAGTEVRLENGVVVAANDPQAYSDWFFGERALLSASLRPPTDPRSTSQKVSDFFDRAYGVDKVSMQSRLDSINNAYKTNYLWGLAREGFEYVNLGRNALGRGLVKVGQSLFEGTYTLLTTNPLTTLQGLGEIPDAMANWTKEKLGKFMFGGGYNDFMKIFAGGEAGRRARLNFISESGQVTGQIGGEIALLWMSGGGAAVKWLANAGKVSITAAKLAGKGKALNYLGRARRLDLKRLAAIGIDVFCPS